MSLSGDAGLADTIGPGHRPQATDQLIGGHHRPLRYSADFKPPRDFMREFAADIAGAHPKIATVEQRKSERGDRVLIDTLRTAYGQTFIAPYAVRARPGAPVATSLRWDEALAADMSPRRYDIENIFRRLGQIEDPWRGMNACKTDARRLLGRTG